MTGNKGDAVRDGRRSRGRMVNVLESGLVLEMRRHHGMALLRWFFRAWRIIVVVVVHIALPREIRRSFVLMGVVLQYSSISNYHPNTNFEAAAPDMESGDTHVLIFP